MEAKVSIIIPNYNHEIFLKKRIESVVNQTYQHFEILILDDCSTDNSRKIIEAYRQHPKVRHIIYNDQNSGSAFKQWKKGIEQSIGEWIWIAESDDWCEPTFLEELVSPVLENKSISLAFCQSLLVSPEKQILYKTSADFLCEIVDGKTFVTKKMLGVNHILNASMVIFKRSAFYNISDDYTKMKYCGDWLFWVQICLQGKVYISGKYLNYYLRHENNVATLAVKNGLDFLEGNKVFNYIIRTVNVHLQEKKEALNIRVNMYLERKHLFFNDEIKEQVSESMLTLDPSIKAVIKARRKQKVLQRLRSGLQRYISRLFQN